MTSQTNPEDHDLREPQAARRPGPEGPQPASDVADLPVNTVMSTRVLVTTPDDDALLAWELMVQAG
ncbi:hypothetical protein [Pseudofrankia asymbiotica]|uniref:Uncharacterized protein n=1 Tax=Pseudofrankia asymbiotica TaxID=1834516 RepID=A0A1V2I008_9ACTN|nr:hypothetical protein [Pseudofrankia asymbiotica]ONH22601.1 hypothetical protein BL253_35255 [Pseudofrankia asymbiotica]